MPRKILLVGEYGAINGGENSLMAILPELQKKGFGFEALVPGDSGFSSALNSLDVKTHPFEPGSGPTRKSQDEIRKEIAEVIRAVNPDLDHANSLSAGRLCGPVTAELNMPSVGYLRDIMGLSKKAVSDINQLDRIIAVSEATRQSHIKQGMLAARIITIHNGVDLEAFHPPTDLSDADSVRSELGISNDVKLILYVGQIGMRKGLDTLVETFSILKEEVENLHLAIVGIRHSQKDEAIDYEANLHSATALFQDRVHWLRRRVDIPRLMRGATMLMHAARQEPLGRALLEASASGLPIAATNVGGTDEILGPSEGFDFPEVLTCEKDNPRQLATIARPILSSAKIHSQISNVFDNLLKRDLRSIVAADNWPNVTYSV